MDSLTQIVLGAACGEAVLGKKIGNKALLFGALGGTIPDLDVFVGSWIYGNEIQAMAFHRGFMHSFLFSIFGSILFGWLVFQLYDTGKRRNSTVLKDWQWLFFWSLFTHPILDSFTPYGTQLFQPFSDIRIAFNTISVVDPLYTLPFLVCLIILMFLNRKKSRRKLWLKWGIGLSSFYLLLTVCNKFYINSVYNSSLKEEQIISERFQTQPTIFNNLLWYGVAETRSFYYVGFYSLLDKKPKVGQWLKIKKQQELLPMENENLSKLAWFSNDYFNIKKTEEDNRFIYYDVRYPLLDPNDPSSFIFSFEIFKENGVWDMKSSMPRKQDELKYSKLFNPMIERLKGI